MSNGSPEDLNYQNSVLFNLQPHFAIDSLGRKQARMPTILKIHGEPPNPKHLAFAAEILRKGEIVLAPTETGYCFMGDAQKDSVYETLLKLRQAHPRQKPFSLLCSSIKQIASLAHLDTPTFRLASRALPGPVTLILNSNRNTPQFSGGPKRKTVGVRISQHAVAQGLAEEFGEPLVLTSVTDAQELLEDSYFEDVQDPDSWWVQPAAILNKFRHGIGCALEWHEFVPLRVSTVVDLTEGAPQILRDGGWEIEHLGLP
jgi:tRNA threonylcarbamoyl adenosine modification protein (Sua5/YciO/YrdC/YwlC family)